MGEASQTVSNDKDSVLASGLIVVASEGLEVSQHFGICTNYNYYRVENGAIVDSQNLPAKGAVDDHYARIFVQFDVDIVIVNDISDAACNDFIKQGIAIARGGEGRAINAAQDYLDGKLDITPAQ